MSLEIKPGTKVVLHLKSTFQPRSGTINHVSATSIILELSLYNRDERGDNVAGYHNFTFEDIERIEPQ